MNFFEQQCNKKVDKLENVCHLFEEIAISPKLKVCGAKEVDIRNQRPRLRRNRLILVEKAGGGGFCKPAPTFFY